MKKHKFIRNRELAKQIWARRDYYKLENFLVTDICKIFVDIHPDSPLTSRKNHYRSFLKYFHEAPIKEISGSELKQWFIAIKEESSLSERTLAQVKCQLTPLFKWLVTEDIVKINPLANIRFRRNVPSKRARCVLNNNELKKLVDDVKSFDPEVLYPYLYALVQTGARRSEVAKLKWEDTDLENGYLMFRNTKNGSDRKIKISRNLQSLLVEKTKDSEFVFPGHNGQIFNRSAIERAVAKFKMSNSEKKDWHIHDLRHSYASNFLIKGGEMYQLQAILGHKSIQMTVDLYGNLKSHDINDPSPYEF